MSNHPILDYRQRGPDAQMVRRWLPLVIGVAVGMRIAVGTMHPFWFPDSVDYDHLARAILQGRPYEAAGHAASRMPGYPVFVAMLYALSNMSAQAVYIAQGVLGGATVYLIYLLGRRVNRGVGLLAAFLAAVDPLSVGFSASFLSEVPFTFCLVLALWAAVRLVETPARGRGHRWTGWALLGILWGVAVYLRASCLWLIVPMLLWIAFFKRNEPFVRNVAFAGLSVTLMFFVLSPWQVRNYRIFGDGYFRLTTLEGMSLYEAVYPGADGGPKQTTIPIPTEIIPLNEAQQNDAWSRMAWEDIRNDPGRIARLAVIKFGRTWSPTFNDAEFGARPVQAFMLLWHIPLYLCALIGLATALRRPMVILLAMPLVYFSLVHMLFLGSVRYRVPLMPIVCLLAAMGAWAVVRKITAARKPRTA